MREIALALQRGGKRADDAVWRALRNFFKIQEEERLVAAVVHFRRQDRTAHRESELIAAEGRFRSAIPVVGPPIGIQLVIAEKLVKTAMQVVGAGSRSHRQDPAAGAAEFAREVVRNHLELRHRLEWRRVLDVVGGAVAGLGPIEQHFAGIRTAAVDDRSDTRISRGHDTGRPGHQAIRVAAAQRQLENLPAADHVAERGALLFELHGAGLHTHLALHRPHFELHVDGRRQSDREVDAGDTGFLEAGVFDGDFIFTRRQIGRAVVSVGVGPRDRLHAGSHIPYGDLGAGDKRVGLVCHRSGDGPLFDLRRTNHRAGDGKADDGDQPRRFLRHARSLPFNADFL